MTIRNRALAISAITAAVWLNAAHAQDKRANVPAAEPALDEVTCRTLLRLDGEERGYTLVYLHGYVSGKRGQTRAPSDELAQATDRVIDDCIDHPDAKLLTVFERARRQ